jgi:hypothetical protein
MKKIKCQAQTSEWCEKEITKGKEKIIKTLFVCGRCYNKIKREQKKK